MAGVVLAERYRIDGVLGEGGMAVVFDGHHLGLDRAIAIKVLRPEFVADAQIRARFEQEARAVSRLEHPGIVKMFDVGTAEVPGLLTPIAFLVMERLRGVELSDLLRDDGPAPADVALGWLEAMLAAITHAHARGVVHRDLKPENVFACENPGGGRVLKLVDFGIAKMVQPRGDEPLTQMGMIFGTPAYMSPEQATGQPVDGRTDLYSAGIILFEMLSGGVPFAAAEMMEVLRLQVREPAPKLPVAAPVAAILDRLLAKSPEDRYPDAQTALEAVREARGVLGESGPLQAPTAQSSALAPTLGTPTAAAIHESLEPPATQAPRSPPAPTAPAIHESIGDAPAPVAVTKAPASAVPEPSLPLHRGALLGAGVAAAAVLGLLASGTLSRAGLSPEELEAAVSLPAAPTRAAPEALSSVDGKLEANERSAARGLLAPLLEAFPEDPAVAWRAALAQDNPRSESKARAELLLRAIRLDPNRLEDTSAQAFVLRELERAVVPEALLTLVLDHGEPMRDAWIKALLGDRRPALPHAQRHRLLDVLGEPADGAWDPIEHRCHDLWQAETTDRACTVYADTLDAMLSAPSVSYRRSLETVEVPVAGPAEKAVACADLQARRNAVLESIAGTEGDPGFIPRDYVKRSKAPAQKAKKRTSFGKRLRNALR